MKVVAKKIEMIAYFDKDGKVKPLRFRLEEDDANTVVKINKIITIDSEKYCGNKMLVYTCSAVINNVEKVFEIKFDIEGHRWILFKI